MYNKKAEDEPRPAARLRRSSVSSFRASGSSHDSVSAYIPAPAPAAPHTAAQQDPGVMAVHLLVQQPGREHLPVLQPNPRRGHSTWFTKSKNGISRSINQMMYSMLRFGYPKWSVIPSDERELWFQAVSNVEEDTFVDSLDDSDKEVDETQVVESPSELSRDSKSSVSSVSYSDESSELIVEKVWRQCSRDNSDELKENPEARRSLDQIPQNQWYLAHDGCRRYGIMEIYTEALFSDCRAFNLADHLEEFRKASIAYVVMPLDDNTFQVAAASGNDVWIVQMSDCTICTCGDFQRCTRSSRLQEAETQPFESYHRGRKLTDFRDCFLHLSSVWIVLVPNSPYETSCSRMNLIPAIKKASTSCARAHDH
ncbi:hypothetical protein F2Q70_00015826, partial [Brassica cretica]